MPGSLIHHLPPLVAGQDGGEQLVLSMKGPEGSQLLPFPPKSAVAPLTQPQQHFLQLCPYTADGTRLTATSGSEGSQQHPACPLARPHTRNTLVQLETQHLLSTCPLLPHH